MAVMLILPLYILDCYRIVYKLTIYIIHYLIYITYMLFRDQNMCVLGRLYSSYRTTATTQIRQHPYTINVICHHPQQTFSIQNENGFDIREYKYILHVRPFLVLVYLRFSINMINRIVIFKTLLFVCHILRYMYTYSR